MVPAPRELRPDPIRSALTLGGVFAVPMALIFAPLGGVLGLILGLPLGPCALVTGVIGFLVTGLGVGAMGGALFGGMMAAFQQAMVGEGQLPTDLEPDEDVIVYGIANHQRGMEGVGGSLVLTDRRLRFQPHAVNVQSERSEWPLSAITSATTGKSMGLIPNRLIVTGTDGTEQRFVVEAPAEWVAALDEAMGGQV